MKKKSGSVVGALITANLDKGNVKGKAKAGKSGKQFEGLVYGLAKNIGFEVCNSCQRQVNKKDLFGDDNPSPKNRIICNAPYKGVLQQTAERLGMKCRNGSPRTEFVLSAYDINPTEEFPGVVKGKENRIRVECKWQDSKGTTECKLLFSYLDLLYGTPEENIILLIDGKGFSPKMLTFIREVCEHDTITWSKSVKPNKTIIFMDTEQFYDWINRAFS